MHFNRKSDIGIFERQFCRYANRNRRNGWKIVKNSQGGYGSITRQMINCVGSVDTISKYGKRELSVLGKLIAQTSTFSPFQLFDS